MNNLGERIAYYRNLKGLSIKSLAENICDDSTIYRLEKGKQLPRIEILNDICMKLEINFNTLLPIGSETADLKKLCREFAYKEDYQSLELILEECSYYLNRLTSNYSKAQFTKFIEWHRAIVLHKRDNCVDEALSILTELVVLNKVSSEIDIGIMNSIGLIYLSNMKYESAYKIYQKIYTNVMNLEIIEDYTLLPRVGYNYAYSLYETGQYKEGLTIAKQVLKYLNESHLLYLLGEIHHMIGVFSKKNGDSKESKEAFKNAILVFTLTKNVKDLARSEKDLLEIN